MLLHNKVKIKWNSANSKHYIERGYNFTKIGEEFEAHIIDVSKGCNSYVKVQCDYCGGITSKPLYNYFKDINGVVKKDACIKCCQIKKDEVILKKYGVKCTQEIEEIREKSLTTMYKKYGCDNPMKNENFKLIYFKNVKDKYNGLLPFQLESVKKKIRDTLMKRYGVTSYLKTDYIQRLRTGENNPNWNPLHIQTERETKEYRIWRTSVFERDGYTCQCCLHRGGDINAHHIFNYADNKDVRTHIDNGITLCKKCHNEFHLLYGYRNTNDLQLTNFILTYGKNIV